MFYPETFEIKIGFDKIRALIKSYCKGNAGKLLVDTMQPSVDINLITSNLLLTEEMKRICLLKLEYPASTYADIQDITKRLLIPDAYIEIEGFIAIKDLLSKLKAITGFISKQNQSEIPELISKINKYLFPQFVVERLNQVISKNGNIKDNASPELSSIRKELNHKHKQVSEQLNKILVHIRSNAWLSSDLSATMVNGRIVLPIDSTYKRKIKGVVHDESATGKTSYIEPEEVLTNNNEIRALELAEQREIQQILKGLADDLRPYANEIEYSETLIAELDFIRAKSLYAIEINAIKPSVHNETNIDIVKGIHPILEYNYRKSEKTVIPIDISLNNEQRIIVISGPNAGGKSVALKTIALLQYMTQCGILIPVGGQTSMGIFSNIFIDLGDEQSIDNDLSTYSSHLLNMKFFMNQSNANSLILIDEFGAGTDPSLGGAIAEGILNALVKTQCKGVITTHYTNLKLYAGKTEGVENAAMMIDNHKMIPLYQLQIGLPGSSYAIEIAHRTGLSDEVINYARNIAGSHQTDFDKHLRNVLRDKRFWERKRAEIKKQEKNLDRITETYAHKLKEIKEKEQLIIKTAKQESETILKEINKKIEKTIREIKEVKADKEKTRDLRKEIEQFTNNIHEQFKEKTEINPLEQEIQKEINYLKNRKIKRGETPTIQTHVKLDPSEIHIGSKVRIVGQNSIGEVTDLGENNAVVVFGQMYMSIDKLQLEKVSKQEYESQQRNSANTKEIDSSFRESLKTFKPYIDLRGFSGEEALAAVIEMLDRAIVLKVKELKILHGKGNGILRTYLREYLNNQVEVQQCADEDIRFGGAGITVVTLK